MEIESILEGYRNGFFIMADDDGSLQWYASLQRALIPLDDRFHISSSLERKIKIGTFSLKINADFEGTVRGCMNRKETWITPELVEIYKQLHKAGYANSFETWQNGELAGGVLGIVLGSAFIGETMFHYKTDASKVAMAGLVNHLNQKGFRLFDAQIMNPHLARFGAFTISEKEYMKKLKRCLGEKPVFN